MQRKEHKKNLYILHSSGCMLQFTLRKLKKKYASLCQFKQSEVGGWEKRLKYNTLPCGILYLAVLTTRPQLMSPQRHLDRKGLPCASKHMNFKLYLVWGVTVKALFSSLFITGSIITTIITIPHQKRFSGGWQSLQSRGKPDCHKTPLGSAFPVAKELLRLSRETSLLRIYPHVISWS